MAAKTDVGFWRDFVWRIQAAAARFLVGVMRCLPLERASAIGGWLGRTFGPILSRTAVARRNLARAFPEKSAADIEAIVHAMWENLGRTIIEYAHLDRFGAGNPYIELQGAEYLYALRDDGRPGIMFSGHFANWELLGVTAAMHGTPLNLVYRAPNNPHLAWLYELRRSGDAEMIPKGTEGARAAMKLLQRGAHLALLADQKLNDGIPVPFFGREAMTAPAMARYALRFDCPVVPAHIRRLGGVRFRITVFPPLVINRTGNDAADVREMMAQVNALLEQWIRDEPEQWFWLHRRWPD